MVSPLAAAFTASSNVGYPVSPIHATEGAAEGAAAGAAAGAAVPFSEDVPAPFSEDVPAPFSGVVSAPFSGVVSAPFFEGVSAPFSEDTVVPSSANATVGSNPASIVQHSRMLSSIESLLLVLIKIPPNCLIGGYRKPPQSAKN